MQNPSPSLTNNELKTLSPTGHSLVQSYFSTSCRVTTVPWLSFRNRTCLILFTAGNKTMIASLKGTCHSSCYISQPRLPSNFKGFLLLISRRSSNPYNADLYSKLHPCPKTMVSLGVLHRRFDVPGNRCDGSFPAISAN